ncbi:MAG: hypothetical protein EOP62_02410 [Sphingomonadales bacterium]|nr:MAG: hypothetical protein EOP62_02410 [Sphingomonadales bacterium]
MDHSLDAGKSRLRAFVDAGLEALPRLPMVHSTDCYSFADVLAGGTLQPQNCPVFTGEQLTYLFYGRPAFRPNIGAEPTSLTHFFPVCIIFRTEWLPEIRRIFPFDSGAFHGGFYDAYLHHQMKLGDFALEPDAITPGKLIGRFFSTAGAYLTARPKIAPTFDASEFEAQSYSALINAREGNAIDSRGSGIEVQTASPITIADAVAAVILPSPFADGASGAALKKLGIAALPYRITDRSRPNEFMSQITDICYNYYIRTQIVAESEL